MSLTPKPLFSSEEDYLALTSILNLNLTLTTRFSKVVLPPTLLLVLTQKQKPNPNLNSDALLNYRVQARVLKYLRQMAVITPYAEFDLRYESETTRLFSAYFSRQAPVNIDPAKLL